MNIRIQGLYAAIHDFGEARHIADISHRNACFLDGFHRPARGDDFHTGFMELAGELDHAFFIGYANQGTLNLHLSVLLYASYAKIVTLRPSTFNFPSQYSRIHSG